MHDLGTMTKTEERNVESGEGTELISFSWHLFLLVWGFKTRVPQLEKCSATLGK